MLSDVVTLLRCPHCGGELQLEQQQLRCEQGHSFDVARQGYVNLLPRRPATGTGDSATMVQARASFLGRGHYQPFATALAAAMAQVPLDEPVAEIGAGTAYYLAHALEERRGPGLAADVSTYAARRAARAHQRIGSVVADAWTRLPLADGCLGGAMVAFAPRSGGELARVVAAGGRLVVLVPAPEHLVELRTALSLIAVDPRKQERLEESLGGDFELVERRALRWSATFDHADVTDLVLMGPNARHQGESLHEQVAGLASAFRVTVSGVVHVLQRR
ncbi:MAG TPA: rRNA (guanine-N1)-methyltransferase [Actinomycetales bacterium]|nr:rRNA (guanine-N1)-methyltransferase [Actinomycetales bacterium]